MAGKGVVRSIKNYAKGFSEVQIKVREATSNDTWGPSGSLMNEIAQLTFNEHDFIEIMDMIDRRLNDKGKNWRHVFKALLLLDYCLHVGSENVVLYAKENIYVVRTLKEFQHIDDTGKDVGFNIRQKAKDITSLLLDEQRLKEERRSRQQMQDKMSNIGDYMNDQMLVGKSSRAIEDHPTYQHPGYLDEDQDLKKAIEESKRMAEQEFRKRGEGTDADLQKALEESEREARESERKKREALERQNQENLFGNGQQTFQPFPATQTFDSSFNPYSLQSQPTGLSFAEPIQQQQQNFSNPYQGGGGFNQFSLQAQMTGMPPQQQAQFTGAVQQQQFTGAQPFNGSQSFNPAQSQQFTGAQSQQFTGAQSQQFTGAQPQQFTGAQTTPFSTAPQQAQFTGVQQPQFTGAINNPFGVQQQQQQNGMFGTPTGVNPQITGMQPSPATGITSNNHSSDPRYSKLNSMLANRDDGMDTFGNTGNLRIPYGTGFASSSVSQNNNNNKDLLSIADSPSSSFSQPFSQQPNRNPFGQPNTPTSMTTTSGQQKSLLEMMQEQKLQQQQMTGYNQPQMTGMQQGFISNQQQGFGNQPSSSFF